MLFNNSKKDYKNSIIIYFSRADENYAVGYIEKGNTKIVAEYIKELTNADIFEVKPKNSYSKEYKICVKEAVERIKTHNAPILGKIPDISKYDLIYIGSPVYCGIMPEELSTALKDVNFKGKEIKIFVTHEGSGLARILDQIKDICTGAKIIDSIAIIGSNANNSKEEIKKWI